MSVPNALGSDPDTVAPSETESQPAVPRPMLHEAGRSVLPAVGGIVEGNGLPCDAFGIPNALDNSPEGRASDVKRRKPRVVWDNDAKKALVLQVRIVRNPNAALVHHFSVVAWIPNCTQSGLHVKAIIALCIWFSLEW